MNKRHGKRWPGRRGLPRPSIPSSAREKVTELYSGGNKSRSEFWLGGHLVGVVVWSYDADGKTPVPGIAWGVRKGRPDGYRVSCEWRPNVGWYVEYAEPFVDGLLHGWAKQYTPRGKLLMASPFVRGTGIDFWCFDSGALCEEHPSVAGANSGCERWWVEANDTIAEERWWRENQVHGIVREWNWRKGRLKPGFPKFFVRNKEVLKATYLNARQRDSTLVEYRKADDKPERPLPKQFLVLRRRARRLRRARKKGKDGR